MRHPTIACLVATLVVACAHGPRVIKVEAGHSPALDNSYVFYTLPRTLVAVDLPVTVRTVNKGLLHEPVGGRVFDPAAKCDDAARPDLHRRLCLHGLRPVQPRRADAFYDCPLSGAVLGGPAVQKASVQPVSDPAHIYAVRMRAGGFETLNTSLKLSEHGAPTAFTATGESAWLEVTQYLIGAAIGGAGGMKAMNQTETPVAQSSDLKPPDAETVLNSIREIEERRLRLAQAGTLSPASRDVMDAELTRLKQILQGQVVETQVTARLVFDPAAATGIYAASQPLDALCPGKTVGGNHLPEPVIAWLSLDTLASHQVFVERIRDHTVEPRAADDSGLRYRVPSLATGRVVLLPHGRPPCAAPVPFTGGECQREAALPAGSRWVPLESSLTIAQGGPVRSLPRRLGFGSGSIEAELSPASGGLTSVGSDSKGTGYEALRTIVDEAGTDHELAALEREAKLLQQRKSICDSRRALGMAIPQDCNEAKSPGQ